MPLLAAANDLKNAGFLERARRLAQQSLQNSQTPQDRQNAETFLIENLIPSNNRNHGKQNVPLFGLPQNVISLTICAIRSRCMIIFRLFIVLSTITVLLS